MFDLKYYAELKSVLNTFYELVAVRQQANEKLRYAPGMSSGFQALGELQKNFISIQHQFFHMLDVHREYLEWYFVLHPMKGVNKFKYNV